MKKLLAKYIRVERVSTGSFMSYILEEPVDLMDTEDYVETHLPGWDLIWGSMFPEDNNDEL